MPAFARGSTARSILLAALLSLAPVVANAQATPAAPGGATQPAASAPAPVLRVSTRVLEPLVVRDGENLSGFSIDIWREIARRAGLRYEFVVVDTVRQMLDELEAGRVQASIAAISMTPEREAQFDFSHAYLQSGLQILAGVRDEGWLDLLRATEWSRVAQALGLLALLNVFFATLIWLAERKHNPQFPKRWLPGIGEGLWWAVVTLLTVGYGDRTPIRTTGRVIATVWMLASVVIVANYTAAIAARATVRGLQTQISGPADLPGKRVATVAQTTAARYLEKHAIVHIVVERLDQAIERLEAGRVDAVVFDAPVLAHYANTRGRGKARVVGEVFHPEPYGVALARDSPWRKAINTAILEIYNDGTYQALSERWFGTR